MAQSFTLRDMYCYEVTTKLWSTKEQNKLLRFGRRNHVAWSLSKFMLVFGGMNDFNHTMNDLAVYDLEKNTWLDDLKIKNSQNVPPVSHAGAVTVFHEPRNIVYLKSLCSLPDIDLSNSKQKFK